MNSVWSWTFSLILVRVRVWLWENRTRTRWASTPRAESQHQKCHMIFRWFPCTGPLIPREEAVPTMTQQTLLMLIQQNQKPPKHNTQPSCRRTNSSTMSSLTWSRMSAGYCFLLKQDAQMEIWVEYTHSLSCWESGVQTDSTLMSVQSIWSYSSWLA